MVGARNRYAPYVGAAPSMVLVDTSVWVSHLQKGVTELESLLLDTEVASHPFIIGELACGGIKNRKEILSLIQALPSTPVVTDEEFMYFLEANKLSNKGIGFVDVHLLASAKMSRISLWTEDKNLQKAAKRLKLSYI